MQRKKDNKCNKAYRYRIYPNKEQKQFFEDCFEAARYYWNTLLEHREELYEKYYDAENKVWTDPEKQKESNPYGLSKWFNNEYAKDNCPWMSDVDQNLKTYTRDSLQNSLDRYFDYLKAPKGKIKLGKPRYKSKYTSKKSYTTDGRQVKIFFEENAVKLPKVGRVKAVLHRKFEQESVIKTATITKEGDGAYYVSLTVAYDKDVTTPENHNEKVVGIDVGSESLVIEDNGRKHENPRYYRNLEKKIKRVQKSLSRKQGSKKGEEKSNNYRKELKKLNKLNAHMRHQRDYHFHQISKELTDNNDVICTEDLNIQGMMQNRKQSKNFADAGLYGLFSKIEYKAKDKGKKVVHVTRWYASSKTCHCCGYKYKELSLNEREWTCPECGAHHDRDINAAINIKNEGMRILRENA